MNILFYRYNSICEPDMIEVLGRYSNSIDEITIEMDDKNISSKECLCALSSALQQKNYDVVFSINFFPVISEVYLKYGMFVGLLIVRLWNYIPTRFETHVIESFFLTMHYMRSFIRKIQHVFTICL